MQVRSQLRFRSGASSFSSRWLSPERGGSQGDSAENRQHRAQRSKPRLDMVFGSAAHLEFPADAGFSKIRK